MRIRQRERKRSADLGANLLQTAIFRSNLTTSLVPYVGAGGPTWSRATKAWGFNELGYLEEIASGCAFFGGARLVRNLAPRSEVVNAGWTLGGVTASDANTLLESAGGTTHQCATPFITLGTYLLESWMKRGAGSTRHVRLEVSSTDTARVNFNLDTGEVSSIVQSGSLSLISYGADADVDAGGYRRFYIRVNASASANNTFYPARLTEGLNGAISYSGDGTSSILISKVKISDVTNYDASYIPEYVSVGVEASPYFGAGIDGAKYFETDWQGAPIAAANLLGFRREASAINNLRSCRDLRAGGSDTPWWKSNTIEPELVTNGDFSADSGWVKGTGWTISGGTANFAPGTASRLTLAGVATIGKTYIVTFTIVSFSGSYIALELGSSSGPGSINAAGTYSIQLVCGTVDGHIGFYAPSGTTCVIDNVSVKEAAVQCTQATGLDGIANTATTLTATAADAIILQPITLVSAARCASAYVKRRTGTGTISFTQDGGSTWTDITALINGSTWSRVEITATLANPSTGFKISTSGDAIDVDVVQNEAGTVATSPIVTTTAAVTRNADSLTYQTASNIDFAVGTIYGEIQTPKGSNTRMLVQIGDGYAGITSAGVDSWRSMDGTTTITATGLSDITTAKRKRAVSWGGATQSSCGDGIAPTSGAFDGAFGSGASMEIGQNINGYIGPVAIYNYQMTDAELQALTT